MTKRRVEVLEGTSVSQATMVKKLHQECANFEKQIEKEDNEIEKLLSIIQRLNEKYDKSKVRKRLGVAA
jgi:peptidoglycan hydrolase CwlO-like protein